jgi:replicative DNA helicase
MTSKVNHSDSPPRESEEGQSLPYAADAERGILSCILQADDPKLIDRIKQDLSVDDILHHPSNRLLLNELLWMISKGIPVDVVTVLQHLQDKQLINSIGGPGEIAELFNCVPTPTHYPYYLDILRSKRNLRLTLSSVDAIKSSCYNDAADMDYLRGEILGEVNKIKSIYDIPEKSETFLEQLSATMDEWQAVLDGKASSAIHSPWPSWNEKIGGIKKGFWLVKAPRATGKSSFAMDLCLHTALEHKEPADFYTYEMSSHDLIRRAICRISHVDSKYVFQPDIFKPDQEEIRKIARASQALASAPLTVISCGSMDVDAVCHHIKRNAPRFAAIDYLQLMPDPRGVARDASYERKVAENSVRIKRVNVEVGNTIAVLAQVNNEGEARHSKGPEDDADLALTITEEGLVIDKHRNGEPGITVPVKLSGGSFAFTEDDGF